MLHSLRQELTTVVLSLIQSDYSLDVPLFEDVSVLFRSVAGPLAGLSAVDGSHERGKLARYDPVDVSVLNPLIVLVLLDIESLEIVPPVLDALLEPLQAVQYRALVVALALGGVTERDELPVVGLEGVKCFLRGQLQNDDHERAHQIGGICEFVRPIRAVVEDAVALVLVILKSRGLSTYWRYLEEAGELPGVAVDHGKVERPEVLVEGHIDKVLQSSLYEYILHYLCRRRRMMHSSEGASRRTPSTACLD